MDKKTIKSIVTLVIIALLVVVPFFIFTLNYLEGISMLGYAGNCDSRPIPYEPLWIAAEAAILLVFFLYIILFANSTDTGHHYKFNRILVVVLLLNLAVMLGRCFQYPYIVRKGGFPAIGDYNVGQSHPFMILILICPVLIFYFVLRFNREKILLGKPKKIIVYAVCIFIILVREYISITSFYRECMG